MKKELKEILRSEITDYRKKGHMFLNKEISMLEFKGLSGGMGSYAQKGGKDFMIRLKTPSGIISKEDINKIYNWAVKYKREWIHPTTRQAIQFHDMTIDDVCDLMEEALDYGIYSRGSGGNYPRNVAISPLSGVSKEEVFDIVPYAKKINEHIMSKVNTYKLPRKIKIALANTNEGESHVTATDLGFLAVCENGERKFKVFLGGGLGRNPKLGVEYDELINPLDVIYHVEALTKLFIAEGDYENKNKARIRYIVERMGEEDFIKCYKKHLKEVKESENLDIEITEEKIKKEGIKVSVENKRLISQNTEGLYSVYFHTLGGILKTEVLKGLLDLTNNMEDVSFRLTMNEGLYIINLNGEEAIKVLEYTEDKGVNLNVLESVACIGVPTCQMGIGNSQGLLKSIVEKLQEEKIDKDILPKIHISGCMNSCGVHEIGEIGFYGKMKRVNDKVSKCFELHINGSFEIGNATLGEVIGDIEEENIKEFIFDVYREVSKSNFDFNQWLKSNRDDFDKIVKNYLV